MNPRLALLLPCVFVSACATFLPSPQPKPKPKPGEPVLTIYAAKPWFVEEGIASWYGGRWIGRLTANGERYRANDLTAAHKKLPFHTRVRVTDLKTGRQIIVRINNRGPFKKGRVIDLSVTAARQLGTYDRGLAKVRIEALREIPQMKHPNLSTRKLRAQNEQQNTPQKKQALKPTPTPTPTPKPSPTPAKKSPTSARKKSASSGSPPGNSRHKTSPQRKSHTPRKSS